MPDVFCGTEDVLKFTKYLQRMNGIRGPKPSLISGNFYELKENPNETFDEWIAEYGNHFGYFLGDRPILMISDLDVIQNIFLKNSKQFKDRPKFFLNAKPFVSSVLALRGERWRHVRRLMTPFFTHHKISSQEITDIVVNSVDTCVLKIMTQKEQIVKVDDRMQSITLDIICKCGLNMYDTDVHEENSQLKSAAKEFMASAHNSVVIFATFFPFLRPILSFINNYLTAGRMADWILRHLNKQIQTETQNLSANPNYSIDTKSNNVLKSMLKCFLEKKLERDELTGNALILLLAAYDTTSMGLTYAFYCLAKHQDIQNTLREEIGLHGYQSRYVDMVWSESLRLFPPVATFAQREAAEDVVLNDIFIQKGTIVQLPIWHINHDPNIWPEPHKFNPQRFLPENSDGDERARASFLTFGLGPRTCMGIELARHEARYTLSKMVQKFRIETCAQTPDPLELICPTEILYPKDGLYLRFIPLNE
ncbi:unnamed protein product [Medioppia subpectinata]|uniref:Thromboxane-A synthase n=1 Tax=Medioppia subpectinata TaxID=1979941 RepID=A0A7R9L6B7_9ACAR|nr:unnamed protein product [Medioppia subpectinata]CAG2115301.1 unnamed protein product [Medioppia subpectinata]